MDVAATQESQGKTEPIDFQTDPSRYKHWRLAFDGPVATLTMDVAEDGGIRPGYKLKLNSYDLGVDMSLPAPRTAFFVPVPTFTCSVSLPTRGK